MIYHFLEALNIVFYYFKQLCGLEVALEIKNVFIFTFYELFRVGIISF